MLRVKTKVRESLVHGLGIFADQNIKKGAEVWRFTPGFDRHFTAKEIRAFPPLIRRHFETYSWQGRKSKLYCLCGDHGIFFNHSDTPNILSEYRKGEIEVVTLATRDIRRGEELLDDYNSFL